MNEGAGPGLAGNPAGMREGVAGLAQRHQAVGRRQVERRPQGGGERHGVSRLRPEVPGRSFEPF
jgi:hypothetical protein